MLPGKSASARIQINQDLLDDWKKKISKVNEQLLTSIYFWKSKGNLDLSSYPNRHNVWDIFTYKI